MAFILAALLLLLVASAPPCAAQTGGTDIFRVGGYITGHENVAGSDFVRQYGPSLREYLNQALPGWSFELITLNSTSVYETTAAEGIDFLFTDPATFVCLSSEFAATFLATRSNLLLRWESNYVASAIVKIGRAHV